MATSPPKPVALNDLLRQTRKLRGEIDASVNRVLASGWYILGRECAAFEEEFAAYCGVPHCVTVGNGTDALELAVRSLGIGPGDAVATVGNAGGYSTTAVRAAGAEPLYIDIDLATMNMSAADLAARLTPRVRAVIATHLYGRMADLPALLAVTGRSGVPLIEDCAQAHGASLGGRKAGSWARSPASAFTPPKTWALWAMAAPSPPLTPNSPPK
jgi:dTDP-4-amino-4,6-dideoxygalactose transaminase